MHALGQSKRRLPASISHKPHTLHMFVHKRRHLHTCWAPQQLGMCCCLQEDRIATAKENKLPSGENKLGVKLPRAAASPWVHGSSPSPAKVFDRASISISPSKFFTNNRWTLFFFSIYPGKPDQYLLGFQGQSQSMQQRTGRRTVCSSCPLLRAPVEQGYQAQ